MSMPAVKALKEQYPAMRISWLVEGSVGELLAHQPFIDRVIRFPRSAATGALRRGNIGLARREMGRFLKALREDRYDVDRRFPRHHQERSLRPLCPWTSHRLRKDVRQGEEPPLLPRKGRRPGEEAPQGGEKYAPAPPHRSRGGYPATRPRGPAGCDRLRKPFPRGTGDKAAPLCVEPFFEQGERLQAMGYRPLPGADPAHPGQRPRENRNPLGAR